MEDDMSNFALLTKIKELAERVARVERATIYKVGFWSFLIKWALGFIGVFKFMGF